jgi:hypothetical protein
VAVRDLREGEVIDLKELPYYDGLDVADQMLIEDQYATVGSEDGPRTWETPDCVVLHTDQGSYGLPPDHEFTVLARVLRDGELPARTPPVIEQPDAARMSRDGYTDNTIAAVLQVREQCDTDLLEAARDTDSYAFRMLKAKLRDGVNPFWITSQCAEEAYDREIMTAEEMDRIVDE